MKNTRIPFSAFIICAILFCSGLVHGQSITINSISGTSFCEGDSIAVTFTATGSWLHPNAFTMQLSDSTGSFAEKFKNFGSLNDTEAGTFTITSPNPTGIVSTHYRIRIAGANPYTLSADNGQDITIGRLPNLDLEISDFTTPIGSNELSVGARVGDPVHIRLPTDPLYPDPLQNSTICDWQFGSGAMPPNASGNGAFEEYVTYSTAGDKIIHVTFTGSSGCTESAQITYHIFDCSPPSIPKYTLIDSGNLNGISNKVIWVNPGVTFNVNGTNDTIFCESNSTIYDRGGGNVIYLKPGAYYSDLGHGSGSTIIHANGVSIELQKPSYNQEISCPTLDFDYTNAPPNVAHPVESVKNDLSSVSITFSPNPTKGMLSVKGLPPDIITISVFNTLGEMVLMQKNQSARDFSLDLSKLVAGTYYIRFSSANSVVTKKLIKN
jgi:hypothetical protein